MVERTADRTVDDEVESVEDVEISSTDDSLFGREED